MSVGPFLLLNHILSVGWDATSDHNHMVTAQQTFPQMGLRICPPPPFLRGYSEVEKGLVLRLRGRPGRKGSSPEGVLGRDLAQLPSLGASSRLLVGAPPAELSCGAEGRGGHSRVKLGPASRFEVRGISSTWLDMGTRHTVHKAHQKP